MENHHMASTSALFGLKTFLIAGTLCALTACAGDDGADGSAPGPAHGPEAGATTGRGPRFAVVTQVAASGSMPMSFVSMTDTLSSPEPVSTSDALSIAGRALVANEPGSGSFFVSSGTGGELTKYTLDPAGKPASAGTISFPGAAQIGEYASQLQFVSATKAYYFDTRTAQIFVFNPSTLAAPTAIALPGLQVADAILTFSSTLPVRRGSKIALAAGWRSSNNQRVIPKTALVVLDTSNDTAAVLFGSDRCGYVRDAVEGSDGRVYIATEAWGSSVHRLAPDNAPPPCLMRTNSELTAFDAAYVKDLNAITSGVTGSLTQSRDGKVYTRVLDEDAATITPMTVARALASLPVWSWWELQLGDSPTASKVAGAPLGTGSLIVFDTRDKRYAAEIGATGTGLLDLTTGVGPVSISTSGFTFSAVQVR